MNFRVFSIATTIGAGLYCIFLAWFGNIIIGDKPELMNDPEAMVAVLKEKFLYLGLAAVGLVVLLMLYKKMSRGKTPNTHGQHNLI